MVRCGGGCLELIPMTCGPKRLIGGLDPRKTMRTCPFSSLFMLCAAILGNPSLALRSCTTCRALCEPRVLNHTALFTSQSNDHIGIVASCASNPMITLVLRARSGSSKYPRAARCGLASRRHFGCLPPGRRHVHQKIPSEGGKQSPTITTTDGGNV